MTLTSKGDEKSGITASAPRKLRNHQWREINVSNIGELKLPFSNLRFLHVVFATLTILTFLNLSTHSQAFGDDESVLWNFQSNGIKDGSAPEAGLIMDNQGNLYGMTTYGGAYIAFYVGPFPIFAGTLFKLTPPSTIGGEWAESILWDFGNGKDGIVPGGGLIMDRSGNLYGATLGGGAHGNNGTVFELKPPSASGGPWTESILWSFRKGNDGNGPGGDLTMDSSGNLYGMTNSGGAYGKSQGGYGTVFKLTAPSKNRGKWTESILWSFGNGNDGQNPFAGLIMDDSGNLYGTTAGGGAYGKSQGGDGTVFKLTPPSKNRGKWTESILWNFGNGADGNLLLAGLIMDKSGSLYGTTACGGAYGKPKGGYGTVFQLTPPSAIGGSWTESILWNFGNGNDGNTPYAGLIMDDSGNLYGTTGIGTQTFNCGGGGGGTYGLGTAFELTPPSTSGGNWTESILWDFGNGTDGAQPSAGLIPDSSGNLYGTTSGGGTAGLGQGTVFEIFNTGAFPTPAPTAAPTPVPTELTASPGRLNFGNIEVAKTSTPKKVTLTNKGEAAAQISTVTATAPFTIAGANTCSGEAIASKGTCSFEIEFAPTTVAEATGGIDVTYNGRSPLVALEGKGIASR